MTRRQFYSACFRKAFVTGPTRVVAGWISLILAVGAGLLPLVGTLPAWFDPARTFVLAIVLLWAVSHLILLAPFEVLQEAEAEARRQEEGLRADSQAVLNKQAAEVVRLNDQIRDMANARPTFAFRLVDDQRMTGWPGKVDGLAHWFRIEVSNGPRATAHRCRLEVDDIQPPLAGFVKGPLAEAHFSRPEYDMSPDSTNRFDLCYCWEARGAETVLCVPYQLQIDASSHDYEVRLRFTESTTPAAIVGTYVIAWKGGALTVNERQPLAMNPS